MNITEVYIHSIGKKISIEEFKAHCYKPGHVYKINPHYFHKCVGYKNGGHPVIETFLVLTNINNGDYQVIFHPATEVIEEDYTTCAVLPSLAFVNKVFAGEITEVDPEKYDKLVNKFRNISDNFAKEVENL